MPSTTQTRTTPGPREVWLHTFIAAAAPKFAELGFPIPDEVRASIGFTSKGRRSNRVGECWDRSASGDQHFEMFIVPTLGDTAEIAGILTHELVHAAVGLKAKHGAKFRKAATALGLEGKMTATTTGPAWHAWADPVLKAIGPYPAKALVSGMGSTAGPKQGTRMIKCDCRHCGFAFRTTKLHLEAVAYAPACPACSETMEVQ
jgi:hypothetical protein